MEMNAVHTSLVHSLFPTVSSLPYVSCLLVLLTYWGLNSSKQAVSVQKFLGAIILWVKRDSFLIKLNLNPQVIVIVKLRSTRVLKYQL